MKEIESYLSELSERLEGTIPADLAQERFREVRVHLEEAVRHEGEPAALRRFGTPAANARAIIRQARGYDLKSPASLSFSVGATLAVVLTISYFACERAGTMLQLSLGYWLVFFAALFFAAHCVQTRRWLVLPVAVWSSVALAACFVVEAAFPVRLSSQERAIATASQRDLARTLGKEVQDVATWRSGKTPNQVLVPEWLGSCSYYILGLPFPITFPGPVATDRFVPQPTLQVDEARRSWASNGEAWAIQLENERRAIPFQLAAAEAGFHPPTPLRAAATWWAISSAELAVVLLAYNGLALLLGKILDLPWRRRRLRPVR